MGLFKNSFLWLFVLFILNISRFYVLKKTPTFDAGSSSFSTFLVLVLMGCISAAISRRDSKIKFWDRPFFLSILLWTIGVPLLLMLSLAIIGLFGSESDAFAAFIWGPGLILITLPAGLKAGLLFAFSHALTLNVLNNKSVSSGIGLLALAAFGGWKVMVFLMNPPLPKEERYKQIAQQLSISGNGFDGNVRMLALDPKGNLFVGGEFSQYHGLPADRLVRLSPDGILDPSFKVAFPDQYFFASQLFVLPSGRILIVDQTGILLPAKDGKPERHLNGRCLLTNNKGRILNEYDGLRRLPDTYGYLLTNKNSGSACQLSTIKIDEQGKEFECFLPFSPTDRISIAEDFSMRPSEVKGLNKSIFCVPSRDPENDPRELRKNNIHVVYRYEDRRILFASGYEGKIIRLHADGTEDDEFSANIKDGFNSAITDFAVDAQGSIYVGGIFSNYNGKNGPRVKAIAKLSPDGRLDQSFGQTPAAKN